MSFGEGNLHEKVERLETANGKLRDEINRQADMIDTLCRERDYYREQFARCLSHALKQGRGGNFDKLIAYPLPDGYIEPYQLVTDEINCLREFYTEAAMERDELREKLSHAIDNAHDTLKLGDLEV